MNPAKYRKITGQYQALVRELEERALQVARRECPSNVYGDDIWISGFTPDYVEFKFAQKVNGKIIIFNNCYPITKLFN